MKLFWKHLRGHAGGIGLFGLFFGISLVMCRLYRLPLSTVLYPMGLCAIAGGVYLALDFKKVWQRHRQLGAVAHLTDVLGRRLPEPGSIGEEDCQAIIRLVCQEHETLMGEARQKHQEALDYYTVWAHQIKTPIASMRLHLGNADSPLSRQLLSDLLSVEQYVEMALMFQRLDEHTSDYVIREHRLDPLIRQTVKKFAGEFIRRKVQLRYDPVEGTVITDEKWLSFVIGQVLSNALKYTPSGSVSIFLEAPKTLCIRDTGIGIAPSDLPRVFEKGFTGQNGREEKTASGIGLYLCRRICENLGHGITAESVLGQGTTIRICLEQQPLQVE